MTPKEAYDARKAERAKLKDMDFQVKSATETLMLLDMLDRFVTAVERIADAMPVPKLPLVPSPTGCVCPAGAENGCGNSGCPRRTFRGATW